ncbi:MAG: DNA polymerase III subunit epsilon [Alphaproteobacteria bacterium]|jgi:DNA polymerase-3 subunit epsilon|nr:DNA polymerase III subunit epsilon [Alphaproteobacteria bacterium]
MREIVLDTETTGLDPADGHRIIEIGCVELFNYLPTGKVYHTYINPERDVPQEASAISGIKTEFLKPFPLFSAIVEEFLEFIGDDKLVIHNASFDLKFLNSELGRLNHPLLLPHRATDTLKIARAKFPGSPASLDALCRRFEIDLSSRSKHGALVDSELLAKVYLELVGGRQTAFSFGGKPSTEQVLEKSGNAVATLRPSRSARPHQATPDEILAHNDLIGTIKGSLWKR